MDFELNDDQRMLAETIGRFAEMRRTAAWG